MTKLTPRKIVTESKIEVGPAERRALRELVRRLTGREDVTGSLTIQLGQGSVSDVTLTEVSKAQ